MKISVTVPVYNTAQFLPRCIDSILSQSFTDFELLLVDDGSTDGSGAICNAYAEKDSRIRVFHKENGGASSARNVGLNNAIGEWVTFIDSDDWIEDNYFQVPFNKGVDLYYQNRIFSDGQHDGFLIEQMVKGDAFLAFLADNAHSNVFRMSVCFFYKRCIIESHRIRYEEGVRLGEDRLFIMDYFKCCRSIQVMNNSYYVYNRLNNWETKYVIPWREIDRWLGLFMDRYDALPLKSPEIASTCGFVYNHIDPSEKNVRIRQALSKNVLRYKSIMLENKGWKKRGKYYVLKFISALVYE